MLDRLPDRRSASTNPARDNDLPAVPVIYPAVLGDCFEPALSVLAPSSYKSSSHRFYRRAFMVVGSALTGLYLGDHHLEDRPIIILNHNPVA